MSYQKLNKPTMKITSKSRKKSKILHTTINSITGCKGAYFPCTPQINVLLSIPQVCDISLSSVTKSSILQNILHSQILIQGSCISMISQETENSYATENSVVSVCVCYHLIKCNCYLHSQNVDLNNYIIQLMIKCNRDKNLARTLPTLPPS